MRPRATQQLVGATFLALEGGSGPRKPHGSGRGLGTMPVDPAVQEARGPAEGRGRGVKLALGQQAREDLSRGSFCAPDANVPAPTPAAWCNNPSAGRDPNRGRRFKGLLGAVAELCETSLFGAGKRAGRGGGSTDSRDPPTAGTGPQPLVDLAAQGLSLAGAVIFCETSTFQGLATESNGEYGTFQTKQLAGPNSAASWM